MRLPCPNPHVVQAADVDNDGRIDLFFTTVYEGDTSRLFLNRGKWRFEDVTEGSGNQNALRLHFGLGEAHDPVKVTVRWPDGGRSTHSLSPNRIVRLKQAP